jgi:hypothetical protein
VGARAPIPDELSYLRRKALYQQGGTEIKINCYSIEYKDEQEFATLHLRQI